MSLKAVQAKLAEDDAEIAALEKKLGLKGKKLPKSFEDDGLDVLLEGLDDGIVTRPSPGKRERTEDELWLQNKRRKHAENDLKRINLTQKSKRKEIQHLESEVDASDDELNEDVSEGSETDGDSFAGDELYSESESEAFEGFESETSTEPVRKRVRENPYVAPLVENSASTEKYVPPSLRQLPTSDSEALTRLRRQIQGPLNRLSEANVLSILAEFENIYRENPRQYVHTTIIDLLLTIICDRSNLMDTFLILHAGFIAAVYKVIGTDFGAQIIERVVQDFDKHYQGAKCAANPGKETSNLMSLLAELYIFQVIGSNLMFDYIRMFLSEISEVNTELLLKVTRTSGPQLRHDDPSALKDIVGMLQPAIALAGVENVSVRTKFMVETINNLKNNRMKTGINASAVVSEHTIRMKKTVGSLNTRSLRATEPLGIGLKDILNTKKMGKWWLVGASWKTNEDEDDRDNENGGISQQNEDIGYSSGDLLQIAKQQGMNTDIRRAIFVTIMSASDTNDAFVRLMKLRLKKSQQLEIPRVLIHCAAAEQTYNPYYALISRKLCSEHKLKMAFQFGLWDLFKAMGENTEEGEDNTSFDEEELDVNMSLRKIINLAKMFGTLIADGGLGLNVFKTLNMAVLQPRTKTFLEVLFITIMLQSQTSGSNVRDEGSMQRTFAPAKASPDLARGIQYFLKKVVAKTDVAGGKKEKATVIWGCRVAAASMTIEDV